MVYPLRAHVVRVAAAMCLAACSFSAASAAIIFTDGFGDGDRDNNGLDAGATATDPTDVGIGWFLTDGTSAVTFRAIDDSAGIGSGNALQMFNTASNNRPSIGKFPAVTLAHGDKLVLRLDMRLASTSANVDRAIRWGLYNDVDGNTASADTGSGGTLSLEDVGYNVRIDAGPDSSNTTSMDVTRDDSTTGTIIQGTTTGIGVASTNAANQLLITDLKAHFELTLERSGTSMIVTLQRDSNAAITGTDASPPSFTFNEVALGLRSNAAMDIRVDNIQVEYVPIPEPGGMALALLAACGLAVRWRR